ncbi:MAG: Phospholipid ABC transporter shuttle protein MlaC, partial [uncultured Lysobacter sp.]
EAQSAHPYPRRRADGRIAAGLCPGRRGVSHRFDEGERFREGDRIAEPARAREQHAHPDDAGSAPSGIHQEPWRAQAVRRQRVQPDVRPRLRRAPGTGHARPWCVGRGHQAVRECPQRQPDAALRLLAAGLQHPPEGAREVGNPAARRRGGQGVVGASAPGWWADPGRLPDAQHRQRLEGVRRDGRGRQLRADVPQPVRRTAQAQADRAGRGRSARRQAQRRRVDEL